jgi:hypothetical protein
VGHGKPDGLRDAGDRLIDVDLGSNRGIDPPVEKPSLGPKQAVGAVEPVGEGERSGAGATCRTSPRMPLVSGTNSMSVSLVISTAAGPSRLASGTGNFQATSLAVRSIGRLQRTSITESPASPC